jgi:hypothetical protein
MEVDQPPAILTGAVKDLAAAVSRPSLVAALRAHSKEVVPPSIRSVPLPRGAGLPSGSAGWEIAVMPPAKVAASLKPGKKPPPAAKPVLIHVIVVPDGQRTWMGIGGDDAGLAARLAASLGTTGDKLAGRAELAAFKDGKVGSGGFTTARALPEIPVQLMVAGGGWPPRMTQALEDLDQMPQHGMSPLLFSSTAKEGGPPSVTVATWTIPRGTIEDLVTTILRHGGF